MANTNIYVSHTGSGTVPYDTWAKAATTLAAAITQSGTGGTDFWVDSTQNESTAGLTFTFKGVAATPDRMFSVTTAGSTPPVTADLTAGAVFGTTTTNALTINGNCYIYGCTFSAGTTGSNTILNIGQGSSGADQIFNTCKLVVGSTGSTGSITIGGAASNLAYRTALTNTTVKFGATGQGIIPQGGTLRWLDTASAIDASVAAPSTLFLLNNSNARGGIILCDGVDLSGQGSTKNLTQAGAYFGGVQFVNCKLAASYIIGVPTAPSAAPTDLVISDNSATNYNQIRSAYQGKLIPSTSVYNNATDGDTPISWAVTATANATPQSPFECFQIAQWVAAGTYAATRIQLTSATASLTNNDVWVDVEYLGSSYPLSGHVTTGNVPLLPSGTPASLDTASATWATGTQGNNYDLQIPSFTTSADGYVRFNIKVGKASLTAYIDPAVTIA